MTVLGAVLLFYTKNVLQFGYIAVLRFTVYYDLQYKTVNRLFCFVPTVQFSLRMTE